MGRIWLTKPLIYPMVSPAGTLRYGAAPCNCLLPEACGVKQVALWVLQFISHPPKSLSLETGQWRWWETLLAGWSSRMKPSPPLRAGSSQPFWAALAKAGSLAQTPAELLAVFHLGKCLLATVCLWHPRPSLAQVTIQTLHIPSQILHPFLNSSPSHNSLLHLFRLPDSAPYFLPRSQSPPPPKLSSAPSTTPPQKIAALDHLPR